MVSKERLNAILSSKDTWLCAAAAALLLTIWGGVMTPRTANIGLCLVVLLASAGVYFNSHLLDDPWYVRTFWAATIGGATGLFCYYVLWTFDEPKAKLDIEYRVLGVEKQLWDRGNELEHRALQVNIQIINRSRRSMSLEFTLHAPLKMKNGDDRRMESNALWHYGLSGSLRYPEPSPRGDSVVGVGRESTIEGRLLIDLPLSAYADEYGLQSWESFPDEKLFFEVLDRISGESIVGPFRGYPQGNARPYVEIEYPDKFVKMEDSAKGPKGPQYGPVRLEAVGFDEEFARRAEAGEPLQHYEDTKHYEINILEPE